MSTEVGFGASSIQYCSAQLSTVASNFTTSVWPATAGGADAAFDAGGGLLVGLLCALLLAVVLFARDELSGDVRFIWRTMNSTMMMMKMAMPPPMTIVVQLICGPVGL